MQRLIQRHPRMAWTPFRRLGRWFMLSVATWAGLMVWRWSYDGPPQWPESLAVAALAAALAVFALGWSLRVGTPPDERRGALAWRRWLYRLQQPWWLVEADDHRGVVLTSPLGGRHLDRRDVISACVVEQQGPVVVEWHLTSGRRLATGAESYFVERERLERLGMPADRCWRGFLTQYRSPFRIALWWAPLAWLLAIGASSLLQLLPLPPEATPDLLVGGLFAVQLVLGLWLLRMRQLSNGPDGVAWETAWRLRRLAMSQLAFANGAPQRLTLGMQDGSTLELSCPGLPGPITVELAELITRLAQPVAR